MRWCGVGASVLRVWTRIGFGGDHGEVVGAGGSRWLVSADGLRVGRHAGRVPDDVLVVLDRAFCMAAAFRDDAGLEVVLASIPFDGGTARAVSICGMRCAWNRSAMARWGSGASLGAPSKGAGWGRCSAACTPRRGACRLAFLVGRSSRFRDETWSRRRLPSRHVLASRAVRGAGRRAAQRERHPGCGGWPAAGGLGHDACRAARARSGDGADAELTGWDEHRDATGSVGLNEEALGLCRERWALPRSAAEFRRPHEETQDTRASWEELGEYLS
jgi:hypothetical protein